MSTLRRARTTDLSELRAILTTEIDDAVQENLHKFENEDPIADVDVVPAETQVDEIMGQSDDKENQQVNLHSIKPKSSMKTPRISGVRPKFIVTRIDTKRTPIQPRDQPKSSDQPTYRSIHHSSIIEKEDRINQQLIQLQESLDKEILARTATICEDSINEARQLVQNSLATSRIVGGYLTEIGRIRNDRENNSKTDWKQRLLDNKADQLKVENVHPNVTGPTERETELFGYTVHRMDENQVSLERKSRLRQRTENQLDPTDPHIRVWLDKKNREMEMERQERQEERRIQNTARMASEGVRERRREMSERAFNRWLLDKDEQEYLQPKVQPIPIKLHQDNKPSSHQIHNAVFRRPPFLLERPKTTASFNIRKDINLTVKGEAASIDRPIIKTARQIITYPRSNLKSARVYSRSVDRSDKKENVYSNILTPRISNQASTNSYLIKSNKIRRKSKSSNRKLKLTNDERIESWVSMTHANDINQIQPMDNNVMMDDLQFENSNQKPRNTEPIEISEKQIESQNSQRDENKDKYSYDADFDDGEGLSDDFDDDKYNYSENNYKMYESDASVGEN